MIHINVVFQPLKLRMRTWRHLVVRVSGLLKNEGKINLIIFLEQIQREMSTFWTAHDVYVALSASPFYCCQVSPPFHPQLPAALLSTPCATRLMFLWESQHVVHIPSTIIIQTRSGPGANICPVFPVGIPVSWMHHHTPVCRDLFCVILRISLVTHCKIKTGKLCFSLGKRSRTSLIVNWWKQAGQS